MRYTISADNLFKNGTLINRLQACFNYLTLCNIRHATLDKGYSNIELCIFIMDDDDIDELQKICDENLGNGFKKEIKEFNEDDNHFVTLVYSAQLDKDI